MEHWAIEIDREDIARAWVATEQPAELFEGEVEVAVELVALTANNVTYAALGKPTGLLGEDVGYWDFYAERDAAGRLPVWGFARVTRSAVEGVAAGEAFYGYWPLASHAVMTPERVGRVGFTDGTPRRRGLPALYNGYQRVAALEDHRDDEHDLWPIWRPLQVTGWLVADQFEDEDDRGAQQVLVTAASSKTAIGFAHAMRMREKRPRVIALTSARSEAFVRGTGLYDDVVLYDAVGVLDRVPSALVDFANDPAIVGAVRAALGEALVFDLIVGFTHWDSGAGGKVAGVPRSGFFAPARISKRGAEWGGETLRAKLGDAWRAFMANARGLTAIDERDGAAAALAAYEDAVAGRADPKVAVLLRP